MPPYRGWSESVEQEGSQYWNEYSLSLFPFFPLDFATRGETSSPSTFCVHLADATYAWHNTLVPAGSLLNDRPKLCCVALAVRGYAEYLRTRRRGECSDDRECAAAMKNLCREWCYSVKDRYSAKSLGKGRITDVCRARRRQFFYTFFFFFFA